MTVKHVLLGIAAICYAFSLTWLTIGVQTFTSPDENAAFFSAEKIASGALPLQFEALNFEVNGIVHPRSMITYAGNIVPGSFLGLPLYVGSLGMWIGPLGMRLVTPVLLLLSAWALFQIMHTFSGRRDIAFWSVLFYVLHPGFWYYAARSMMHNVGFVALIVLSVWAIYVAPAKKVWLNWLIAGIFFGLAAAFRTSELLWLGPLAIATIAMYAKQNQQWKHIGMFMLGSFFVMLPVLFYNQALYGSFFETGYTAQFDYGALPELPAAQAETSASHGNLLLPFGFHERLILRHAWFYGFLLHPWITVFGLAGFISVFLQNERKWKWLAGALGVIAAWLFVYYGSWTIHDNPDPSAITIANSYVRYWLPIFALLAPLSGYVIASLLQRLGGIQKSILAAVLGIGITMLSATVVFLGDDGFIQLRQRLLSAEQTKQQILAMTEEYAIFITDFDDKYLFPERRIVYPLRSELTYAHLDTLANAAPLYFYGITFPESDITFLTETRLQPLGLRIQPVKTFGVQTLYRIYEE